MLIDSMLGFCFQITEYSTIPRSRSAQDESGRDAATGERSDDVENDEILVYKIECF